MARPTNTAAGVATAMISVEPLIDMGRTLLNVSDSMVAGILTSRFTGSLDAEAYADRSHAREVAV